MVTSWGQEFVHSMRHTLPIAPQFYVTAPQPCPYLEGRMERKLFTALQGDQAQRLNDALSKQGFRRSQNVLYRPSCAECTGCMSAHTLAAPPSSRHVTARIMASSGLLVSSSSRAASASGLQQRPEQTAASLAERSAEANILYAPQYAPQHLQSGSLQRTMSRPQPTHHSCVKRSTRTKKEAWRSGRQDIVLHSGWCR